MLRNLFFLVFFYSGIILICLIFLPSFILPVRVVLFGGKLMGYWAKICLGLFLGTKIILKGEENIIKNEKFFIACSHQSMFETFFLQTVFNSPIFILKKELLSIPIFGWYLKKIKSISIDRNKINKENLDFYDKIKNSANSTDRPIIIFPQATRVNPHERPPFKKGASRIYEALKIKCQPVAINSGLVWPKKGLLNAGKTITISILKPIETNLESKNFLEVLETSIYNELDRLS